MKLRPPSPPLKGAYDTGSYFLATVACDLVPYRLLPPLILTWVLYGACGLNDGAGRQTLFALVLVLTNLVRSSRACASRDARRARSSARPKALSFSPDLSLRRPSRSLPSQRS